MNVDEQEPDPWAEMDAWLDKHYACLYWGCDDERVHDATVEMLLEAIREWGNTPLPDASGAGDDGKIRKKVNK